MSGTEPNLIYTPNLNYVGSDQFFYTVSTGGVTSYEAQVDITVVGVLPTVTFHVDQTAIDESPSNNTLPVRVNLSVPAVNDLLVGITFWHGTAIPDQDFIAPTQILVRAGESFGSSLINIVDDTIDDNDEYFRLQLVSSPQYISGSPLGYRVDIGDNDSPPAITLDRTSLTMDEANTTATIRVQLSAVATQDIQLPYTLTTQDATLGSDFTLAGGSVFAGGGNYLSIPAGAQSAFLTVGIINDTAVESTESFRVQFSPPAYGVLQAPAASSYTLTIRDNDERIVTLQHSLVSVGEAVGSLSLTAIASPPFTQSTTVPITLRGTALSTSVGTRLLCQFAHRLCIWCEPIHRQPDDTSC